VLISNFHDPRVGELGHATDGFNFFVRRADLDVSLICWTGERLGPGEIRAMKALRRLDAQAPGFAAAAIRLMVEQVRSVASRRRSVGRGVLTLDLPRSVMNARGAERFILHGSPDPDHPTFLYFPAHSEDAMIHGPTYVGDGTVMSNFQAWRPSGAHPGSPSPPV
jgi:hypothetical protein